MVLFFQLHCLRVPAEKEHVLSGDHRVSFLSSNCNRLFGRIAGPSCQKQSLARLV
jgi:hypothetical protein